MMTEPLTLTEANFKPCRRTDIPALMEIDTRSHEYPWEQATFKEMFKTITLVCIDNKPIGYVAYKVSALKLEIFRMAIHPDYRRRQIGTQFFNHLTRAHGSNGRSVEVTVRAAQLDGQLFLRAQNLHCCKTESDFYQFSNGATDDAYVFTSTPKSGKTTPGKPRGPLTVDINIKNRISRYYDKS